MKKTESKYWVNGIQKRGVNFICISFQIGNKAALISFRPYPVKITPLYTAKAYFSIQTFELI